MSFKRALILGLFFGLAGCAVIKSSEQPIGNLDLKRDVHGVNYFLPMQRVKLTASRGFKKVSEIKSQKRKVDESVKRTGEAISTLESEIKAAQKVLKSLKKKEDNASKKAAEDKEAQIAEMAAQLEELKQYKSNLESRSKQLEQAIASAPQNAEALIPEYSFGLSLQPSEPDPAFALQADFRHMPWRDDDLKLSITDKGLLSSSKTESTDQTAEILVQIAKTVSFFATGGLSSVDLKFTDLKASPEETPFTYKPIFDPTDADQVEQINRILLANHATPYCLRVSGKIIDDVSKPSDVQIGDRKKAPGLIYRSRLPYKIEIMELTIPGKHNSPPHGDLCGAILETPGGAPKQLGNVPSIGSLGHPIDSTIVLLPNKGPIGLIPFKANAFVKTVHDVEFKDGLLTKWDTNQPSEILAIVRVPLDIVDGVFEGLSKLIPFQTQQVNNQSDLLKAQAELFKSQQGLLEAQESLEASAAE